MLFCRWWHCSTDSMLFLILEDLVIFLFIFKCFYSLYILFYKLSVTGRAHNEILSLRGIRGLLQRSDYMQPVINVGKNSSYNVTVWYPTAGAHHYFNTSSPPQKGDDVIPLLLLKNRKESKTWNEHRQVILKQVCS